MRQNPTLMKKEVLLILLIISVLYSNLLQAAFSKSETSNRITEAQASQTATAFAKTMGFGQQELQLVSASSIFIYNIGAQGFVIISGSQVLPPILGWSSQGNFPDLTDAPENFSSWIGHYSEMIDLAETNNLQPEASVLRDWTDVTNGIFGVKSESTVDPMISTYWNQDCFFNEYCPSAYGPCGHVYAGCVACAMAQVMKFWNHPAQGFGSHSYIHNTYGEQSANFASTVYRWDEMPNYVYGHNDAIATLLYHCGVSVNMNYSPSGSGAQSATVETALRSYFGYCGAKYREKSAYSDEEWIAILKSELNQGRPLYYSGNNGEAGHAFVCDGYDNNDLFHFNFGWSGNGDGHYSTYDVNGFNLTQAIVMNVYPVEIQADGNGIIYVSEDGTGNGSSWENATNKLEYASALSSGGGIKVWVKEGTYYGDTADPNGAFAITAGNRIYGGFKGNEAPDYDLTQRDFINNATILDGQGSRRVLNQAMPLNSATAALWDGFVIQNGYKGSGAGAYLNNYVTLANCVVTGNTATMFGGGIYINATGNYVQVFLNNCTLTYNSASMGGGVCDRIGATFTNTRISNNTASTKGGGIYLYLNTTPTLKNCVISNNTAKIGGGFYARGKFTAYNCDFVMNQATDNIGGILNENRHNKYYNCILWGNEAHGQPSQMEGVSDFEYCAVQGEVEGTGNLNLPAENDGEEPSYFIRFNHPADGVGAAFFNEDWSLQPASACLNAGKPNTTGLGNTDIAGNQRIQKGRLEIGAYESCASLTKTEGYTYSGNSYYFHGRFLTEEGHYTAVFPHSACDSVVSLDLFVLLGKEEQATTPFSVWPNPTKDLLHIDGEDIMSVEILNILGQCVMQSQTTKILDLSPLNQGLYFMAAVDRLGKKTVTKIMKE